MDAQTVETVDRIGNGPKRALMVGLALAAVLLLSMAFKPRRPSGFTEPGAFGAGHGSISIMFGANPRSGAPRLH
jgi:hypothetical protein